MSVIFGPNDVPADLSIIPELDFSSELTGLRIEGPWFRLAAESLGHHVDENGVEDVISRRAVLVNPGDFEQMFPSLDYVGNVMHAVGRPGGTLSSGPSGKNYSYTPFYRCDMTGAVEGVEPVAFLCEESSAARFVLNPDLWLYLDLEERPPGSGEWWDTRRGEAVIKILDQEDGRLRTVEIRTTYLRKYLRDRQKSLLVGHFRELRLLRPSVQRIKSFVETPDLIIGSSESGAKAVVQNWGFRKGLLGDDYLQRRLHLWFEIPPEPIDTADPWADDPSFDPHVLTLQTREGPVAPGRWKSFRNRDFSKFHCATCDSMARVYFRQDVLAKYEAAAGFTVDDDGSVHCGHYWGLVRSTHRLGNELLSTAIVDFAEGVPFEEWPHWQQYAADPPDDRALNRIRSERPIPDAVNALLDQLAALNHAFLAFSAALPNPSTDQPIWTGSKDWIATKQLKRFYPTGVSDDDFLKRATFLSTLVIDGLRPRFLRGALNQIERDFHLKFDSRDPLGSRLLLERLALVARIIAQVKPDIDKLASLTKLAETNLPLTHDGLTDELRSLYTQTRSELAPLAFLYDLRTHGGLAHPPSPDRVREAASALGLAAGNWTRTDYLRLIEAVETSLRRTAEHLERGAAQNAAVKFPTR